MGWIDTTIITVIILLGIGALYKGLKEPIDALGRLIKRGIDGMKSKSSDTMPGYGTIEYG